MRLVIAFMNPFKKLAGQALVYGLGTILPRLLNFALLVPLYTYVFAPEVYGQFTELYAYVALLLALLTYGMETTFFRHAGKDNFDKVYGNIMTCILSTTLMFVATMWAVHPFLANAMDYKNKEIYILLMGLIVAVDAITAVPFCVLRQRNQPKRFSLIKILNVCTNVAINLVVLLWMPEQATAAANKLFGPEAGLLTWVFLSNLISSLLNIVLLYPEFRQIRLQWDTQLMKRLLGYSLPLMLVNLIGMVNEVADKIIIKYMISDTGSAMRQLGIYGANYKLAVLMTIFIQMFRFASEPFFFSKAKDKESPELFGNVMTIFFVFGLLILLGVTLFIDIFKHLIGPEYWEGLHIVPIVLLANLFLGVVYNLSMWYKLSDKTSAGTVITAIGAVVTIVSLCTLVPTIGYLGAALAHLICYTVIMIVSYVWGQKVYPIPYKVGSCIMYMTVAIAFIAANQLIEPESLWLKYTLSSLYIIAFAGLAYFKDLRRLFAQEY